MKKQKKKPAPKKKATAKKPAAKKPAAFAKDVFTTTEDEKLLLHVGCGQEHDGVRLHPAFKIGNWKQIRLDIDPTVKPDVVADMTDMKIVPDQSVDAVWSSHNIEHLWHHEVVSALKEFHRVLKVNGFLLIEVPNMKKVCELAYKQGIERKIYDSPSGPISPIDIIYGHRNSIKNGAHYMTHKTGFTPNTLAGKLQQAGFLDVHVNFKGLSLDGKAYRRAKKTKENDSPIVVDEDINAYIRNRDEVDRPPTRTYDFNFK